MPEFDGERIDFIVALLVIDFDINVILVPNTVVEAGECEFYR